MDSSQTVAYRPNVRGSVDGTKKLRWPHNFGAYRLADHDVASGSLLGSTTTQIRIKATGAIANVYCVNAGKSPIQTFVLKHWDERTGMKLDPVSGHFFLYPEHQEHRYMLSNGVYVTERIFVNSPPPSAVFYTIEFSNDSEERQQIGTFAFCDLTMHLDDKLVAEYDESLKALVAFSKSEKNLARIVGADSAPASYQTGEDRAMAVTPRYPGRLSGRTDSANAALGVLHYSTTLECAERGSIAFRICVGAEGVEALKKVYAAVDSPQQALTQTQTHYHDTLAQTLVVTPNTEINRGVLWAKANMKRVLLETPLGRGFTNDPMESTKCVARDAAWFCAGSDYFDTDFSRECLTQFLTRQERSGLIPEYFDMLDGRTGDYGLNINDNTPLIVWSAWHHYQLTGDASFLDKAYPALVRACRYIAAQRNDAGLVWCTSTRTGTPGIAGWRNVIQRYRLSGAVTEINAESYGAFRCMAALAAARGDDRTRCEFDETAAKLKDAINAHLFNPGNGLYYLNIDVDGSVRTDITADLLFPVLFGVSDRETSARIVRRLSDTDFWTPGGMRTIPHDAINYSPDDSSGLLGGVWNGVTFWYAKAAAEFLPHFVEEALTNGFENYARNPQRNNTVPGQFSEWLHGQTLVNGGMLLSPWFPPRYIWAVIEGTLGLDLTGEESRITPHVPPHWSWSGIQNMPYRGKRVTWFCARVPELRVWMSADIAASAPAELLDEDISERVHCSGDDAISAALRDRSRIVALIGNMSDRAVTTAVRFRGLNGNFECRRYESMTQAWRPGESMSGHELARGVTVLLEPKGFQLFELQGR